MFILLETQRLNNINNLIGHLSNWVGTLESFILQIKHKIDESQTFRERTLSVQDIVHPGRECNPRPSAYKADALPGKLTRLDRSRFQFWPGSNFVLNRYGWFSEWLVFFCPDFGMMRSLC
jgi:hypothetical protein